MVRRVYCVQGLVNWVPGQLLEPDANANQGLGRQRYPETPLTSICEGHPELQDYMVCPQSGSHGIITTPGPHGVQSGNTAQSVLQLIPMA